MILKIHCESIGDIIELRNTVYEKLRDYEKGTGRNLPYMIAYNKENELQFRYTYPQNTRKKYVLSKRLPKTLLD